jgi:hypothetical protein
MYEKTDWDNIVMFLRRVEIIQRSKLDRHLAHIPGEPDETWTAEDEKRWLEVIDILTWLDPPPVDECECDLN